MQDHEIKEAIRLLNKLLRYIEIPVKKEKILDTLKILESLIE